MTNGIGKNYKIKETVFNNVVTIIFVAFTLIGFIISSGISVNFFLNELIERIFRNGFLVLSLVIPVIAGLGLNFGIVVGAMAGQIAIIFIRYHGFGGLGGLMLCFLLAVPIAVLLGFFTGKLYNKTKGQEMIASLIVGFFADGIYQLLFLVLVGTAIPVSSGNPLIKPDGVGVRMSVDMGAYNDGGMKYSLDNIARIPFIHLALIAGLLMLVYLIVQRIRSKKNPAISKSKTWVFIVNCGLCVAVAAFSLFCVVTDNSFMKLRQAPLVTALVIVAVCVFIQYLMRTKLGQDFRSVGQSQHISKVSGINVDRTRIIATIFSTVFAAWGMIIYLQNMGTLTTYTSHTQIGLFSVAALLVGGATTSKAGVKNALIGVILFNAMTIISPEIGQALFNDPAAGEYFREFMVYGVIGLALGLYVWRAAKAASRQNELPPRGDKQADLLSNIGK